jgi:hypothetical protein
MNEEKLNLTELESNVFFLAELAEKCDNPFFHHGVYRGEVKDDMLVYNSSVSLSIERNECEDVISGLHEKDVLHIRRGNEEASSYANYYYHTASFTGKEVVLEKIGGSLLEKAIKVVNEHPELIECLGCALISRLKGLRYVIMENIDVSPKLLQMMIKNGLLFKNRFVYTGSALARALDLNCSPHLLDKGDIYGVLFRVW